MSNEVRLLRPWTTIEVEQEVLVIVPTIELRCNYCGAKLILHDFNPMAHRYTGEPELRHCDVHMKCPYCGHWNVFGVPITEEEYRELNKSRLKVKTLRWELPKIYEKIEEQLGLKYKEEIELVKKKLELLGYW